MDPVRNIVEEVKREEERKLLEDLAKRKKGKPENRERHGGNSWRHWIDGEDEE